MQDFLAIIAETNVDREKATAGEFDKVRTKLREGTVRKIPDCAIDDTDTAQYDWVNIATMVWVRGLRDDPNYTYERAYTDIGLHNIREVIVELYYYFGEVSRESVARQWGGIWERMDSLERCESCSANIVITWSYCAICGYDFINKVDGYGNSDELSDPDPLVSENEKEPEVENPTT